MSRLPLSWWQAVTATDGVSWLCWCSVVVVVVDVVVVVVVVAVVLVAYSGYLLISGRLFLGLFCQLQSMLL